MANLLIIESATDICSVAMVKEGKLAGVRELLEPFKHSERLTLLIDELMKDCDLGYQDLAGVGVSEGPGSYTSLRVGTSVAKGLCFGLQIPMIALETLKGLAMGMQLENPEANYYIPMIDARRMEVYCGVFDSSLNVLSPVEAKVLEEDSFKEWEEKGQVVLGGNGAEKTRELFSGRNFIFSPVERCQAIFFEKEIQEKFSKNEFADLTYFEP
ncbi:MAG: tRNA (adenosine(37)-N6)-threonylcarbamoyltransferase complex dimerization subunit type 1 TsaB, partial [Saprospiraceae bacterium]|nr:tRNA (adenosine(37)-N6)-threonylcarbamoyltransferase complex dimerization subunit type 1 TsaB [Saprospiraceae bacterium]